MKRGIFLSPATVHKYMNKVLGLRSVTRRKRPNYQYGEAHKKFDNLLNQDFYAEDKNIKWNTDFTYIRLKDGTLRFNCTIIDLNSRYVIASITDRNITADLAKRTLQQGIESQKITDTSKLILHSDQGSQYTSKEFTDYCEKMGIRQSMSKAGCPYDNAPMERYFNTLKAELIYLHEYETEEELYKAIEIYAYVHYNHVRPHFYNNYKTPFEARK